MANTIYDRTLALAGLCQSIALVQAVAQSGHCDSHALETSLNAVLVTNPSQTLSVFGGQEQNLNVGLTYLAQGIDTQSSRSDTTRYLISLLSLERKLATQSASLTTLGERIQMLVRQQAHYDLLDETMLSNFASVYLDVISPLGPRIQVTGSPQVLQQTLNQYKVRALLLSGIRCAVLWRQVGGKRRHLIFGRNSMSQLAQQILNNMPYNPPV